MPTPLPQVIQQQTVSYQNFRVGDGNPNVIGQYGQLGWTYQDWANGKLYVYGEPVSGGPKWLPVLRDEGNIPGSNDGQIFTNDAGYNVWAYEVRNYNSTVMSWGTDSGMSVYGNDGTVSGELHNRVLKSATGATSVDWVQGLTVIDSSEYPGINCGSGVRLLFDDAGTVSIDFGSTFTDAAGSRTLKDSTNTPVLRWNTDNDGFVGINKSDRPDTTYPDWKPIAAVGVTEYEQPSATASYDLLASSANQMTLFLTSASARTTLNLNINEWLTYVPTGSRLVIFARNPVTTINLTHASFTRLGAALTTLAAGASAEFIVSNPYILRIR
jgi:hypothetical protein